MIEREKVESSSIQLDQVVTEIIGETTTPLDQYVNDIRNIFLNLEQISDDDLNKISLRIPVYIYPLIDVIQRIEMRKGVAAEHAKYVKNDNVINATGTVVEKASKAENAAASDRIIELAYKTASSTLQKKVDGALTILDSVKKVRAAREKDKFLASQAGAAAEKMF